MADRYPLVVASGVLQEIPNGDNLNLDGSNIINATSIASTTLTVNTGDLTPIVSGVTTVYVTTSGNDITGDGTLSSPYATPHRAFDAVNARDISEDAELHINVGIGSYMFGLYITNPGSNYTSHRYLPVSGGSGSGAFVGISTAASTSGIVTNVYLVDGGEGYVAGETLGVTTTSGTGLAFTCFHVSPSGKILGPLNIGHKDGVRVKFTGAATTGQRPGDIGNHFYNQAGVGVGSDPSGTGENFDWSVYYDSTSPAGAYPNPMVGGKGNSSQSRAYNENILKGYYGTHLYFYGCDGLRSYENSAEVNQILLIGKTSNGNIGLNNTYPADGVTNTQLDQKSTVFNVNDFEGYITDETHIDPGTGSFVFGDDVAIHGFYRGINLKGSGNISAHNITVTNAIGSGVEGRFGASIKIRNGVVLNCTNGAAVTQGARINTAGAVINNNDSIGLSVSRKSLGIAVFDSFYAPYAGVGGSSFYCNNATGVSVSRASHAIVDGGSSAGSELYIYGNTTVGMAATLAYSSIETSSVAISTASGSSNLFSPPLNEESGQAIIYVG